MPISPAVRRSRLRRHRRQIERARAIERAIPSDVEFMAAVRERHGIFDGDLLERPYAESAWVYRAVVALVDAATSVPLRVYSGDEMEPTPVTAGPWVDLFREPSREMSSLDFWTLTWQHQLLPEGECFWLLLGRTGEPVGRGEMPAELVPYAGSLFRPVTAGGRLVGWKQTVSGREVVRDRWQVVQFRLPTLYQPRRGQSPYSAAKRAAETDWKWDRFNSASLDNGCEPGGVFKSTDPLHPDQVRQIRQMLEDRHGGPANARKPLILGGGLEWEKTSTDPKDMEGAEQRKWSREMIAAAYGVPMLHMGDTSQLHSKESARVIDRILWTGGVIPKLRRARETMRAQLFAAHGGAGLWADWDLSGVEALQADESERMDRARIARDLGVPFAEVNRRFELGFESFEGDGISLVPASMQPLILIDTEPPEPPPQPNPPAPPAGGANSPSGGEEGRGLRSSDEGSDRRRALWRAYINDVHGPNERKLAKAYRSWLRGLRKDILSWLGDGGRAARLLTGDDLTAWLEEQRERWEGKLVAVTGPPRVATIQAALTALAARSGRMPTVALAHPDMIEHLATLEHRIVGTSQTTLARVRETLLQGLSEGENTTALQDRVRAVMNASNTRSRTIARTETGTAAMGATAKAIAREDSIDRVEWIASGDDAVRETHAAQDGMVIPKGTAFPNGLHYPLEADGPPEETINCRCDLAPVVEGDE